MGQQQSTTLPPPPFDNTRAIWVSTLDPMGVFIDALLSTAGDCVEVLSTNMCKCRSQKRWYEAQITAQGEYISIHGNSALVTDVAQYLTPGTIVPHLLAVRHPALLDIRQLDHRYWSILLPPDAALVVYDIGSRCITKCSTASMSPENITRTRTQRREYFRDLFAAMMSAWPRDVCMLTATYYV